MPVDDDAFSMTVGEAEIRVNDEVGRLACGAVHKTGASHRAYLDAMIWRGLGDNRADALTLACLIHEERQRRRVNGTRT